MSSPSSSLPPSLATHVLSALSKRIAFAHIDTELNVVFASDELNAFVEVETMLVGQPLVDHFYEFIGSESFLDEVLHGREPEFHIKDINRISAAGEATYYHFRVTQFNPGQPQDGLLLVVEDQTESGLLHQELTQERNELRLVQAALAQANTKLQRLDYLKSRFLSIAAHDMRSPLGLIKGYAELIQQMQLLENPYQKFLGIIVDQVMWMNRLIGDMLDLNRVEQGQLPVTLKHGDLRAPVNAVAYAFEPSLERKKIKLVTDLPETAVPIAIDQARIEQVLYNLLGNSLKFLGDDGCLTISVSADQDMGVLRFSDNGRGMLPDELPNIFKLYHQAPGKEMASGLGLGLFIVKTMVEAHHGTIEVESEYGVGTTFVIQIPLIKQRDEVENE